MVMFKMFSGNKETRIFVMLAKKESSENSYAEELPDTKGKCKIYLSIIVKKSCEENPNDKFNKFITWKIDTPTYKQLQNEIDAFLREKCNFATTFSISKCDYIMEYRVELTDPIKGRVILTSPQGREIAVISEEIKRPTENLEIKLKEKAIELLREKIMPQVLKQTEGN